MKLNGSENVSGRVANTAATLVFFLSLAVPAFSQANGVNAALAVSSLGMQAPKGVKVLARVAMDGQPVTRMFTQWEHGHNYLYIERGGQPLTAVDITKKRHPQVVNHEPAKPEAKQYEYSQEGTLEVSPLWAVDEGFDNGSSGGTFSVLKDSDPEDAQLLQAFGRENSNLADSDRHLIFFASPAQLLIVEDGRWKAVDYSINN